MDEWLEKIFADPDLLQMGHAQRLADRNLGLGWVYYGLARSSRPKLTVVIGSYRGFVPLILGKAMSDNSEGGRVIFIDPSFVDDFWKDAEAVRAHFEHFSVTNVEHYLMTTQDFVKTETYRNLGEVGMLFVDGYHSEEQARFDYETFEPLLAPRGLVLFHDTRRVRISDMYGSGEYTYEHNVIQLMEKLRQDNQLQVFDLPFGDGVTLVCKMAANEAAPKDTTVATPAAADTSQSASSS